jgi:hypothetical protein
MNFSQSKPTLPIYQLPSAIPPLLITFICSFCSRVLQFTITMASLRVCTLGRSFLSRGSPTRIASAAFRSTKVGIVTTQRQFTSNLWLRQEAAQEHSTIGQPMVPAKDIPEAQRNKNARSVAVLALPKEWTRADLETLFQQNGLQMCVLKLGRACSYLLTRCNAVTCPY